MTTTQPQQLYKPKGAIALNEPSAKIQLRLGIQGGFGSGKTFAATTFKNPVFLSLDRGLASHTGRKDIIETPFWNPAFVDSVCKRESVTYFNHKVNATKITPPNIKDALVKWLAEEASKLSPEQTLVIDGQSGIETAYHAGYWVNPKITKSQQGRGGGEVDGYAEWNQKVDYFDEIMLYIKSLSCDVIWIAHEMQERDSKGNLTGKVDPLLTGQYADKIGKEFTDWYRATVLSKPKTEEEKNEKVAAIGSRELYDEYIKSTPSNVQCVYLWQTQTSDIVKCKTSLVGAPKYVLAHSSTFERYKRKISTDV